MLDKIQIELSTRPVDFFVVFNFRAKLILELDFYGFQFSSEADFLVEFFVDILWLIFFKFLLSFSLSFPFTFKK